MTCQHMRILNVSAKCSDCCGISYINKGFPTLDRDGQVPYDLNIGGGDYIELSYCLDCGKILNGEFPVKESAVDAAFMET